MDIPKLVSAGLFVPRSAYSLLRGVLRLDTLAAFAAQAGFPALALADWGNLYGLPLLVSACKDSGIKPLAAAALPEGPREACIALALNREGYGRLCALLSRRFAIIDPYRNPGAFSLLPALEELASASGLGGLAFLCEDLGRALALAKLGARVYLSLRYGRDFRSLARAGAAAGLSLLAISRPLAFDALDDYRWRLMRSIDLRLSLSALDAALGSGALPEEEIPERSWRPCRAEDMAQLFASVPTALSNASALLEEAEPAQAFLSSSPIFPAYSIPSSESLPGLNPGKTLSAGQAEALLRRLCREGIGRRYGAGGYLRSDISTRLDRELAMIGAKGFAPYFLTVRDIVRGCPRTCGRGSAASSIVSYLLELTHVDPLEHDLYFERFLNEGRKDPPDIDIDFPWDERPALLASVFKRYAGRSAMVADHCFFRRRGALREVGIAFGSSDAELEAWAGLHSAGRWDEIPFGPRRSAELLRGLPRYVGLHPGGVVIVPGPITDYLHVQPSLAGYPLGAWEKEGVEASGLVKIDLLGNRSLAVLRDCIELCRPLLPADRKIEWGDFSVVHDRATRRLIEAGDSLGVFYVESPATRSLLKKMGRGDYEHLVAASSIIRPAANRWIGEYLDRLHGLSWERLPEAVEDALRETYGIMVYQEDVSRVAQAAAGFDATQADGLRKVLTKKDRRLRIPAFRDSFFSGCRERGIREDQASRIWEMMLSFDGYSFCKAHSASYALVSYKLAYLKARRPLEFLCAVVNNGGGFYSRQVYLNEARRLGFALLPPHVNHSQALYTLEYGAPGAGSSGMETLGSATPQGKPALRTGLSQLKGISAALCARLTAAREGGGPFKSLEDFCRRGHPDKSELRSLVLSGALDGLGPWSGSMPATRPALLWAWEGLAAPGGKGAGAEKYAGAESVAEAQNELFARQDPPCPAGDYQSAEKLSDEQACLGLLVSGHPASLFNGRALKAAALRGLNKPIDSRCIAQARGRTVCLCGTLAAGKEILSSNGKAMGFLSFEDEYGIFETVLFPQAYERLMPILEGNRAFLVVGLVQDDYGSLSIELRDLVGLSRPLSVYRRGVS